MVRLIGPDGKESDFMARYDADGFCDAFPGWTWRELKPGE